LSEDGFGAELKEGFTLTKGERTETFKYHHDFGLTQKTGGAVEAVWLSHGLWKLERLGLSSTPRAAVKVGPPSVDTVRAMATGKAVAPPAAPMPLTPPKAATPVAHSPELAQAILKAAEAGHLMPKSPSARAMTPAAMNEPDPPEVVAARMNGQRPSAGAEAILAQFGCDEIVAKINAENFPKG
jgi:hypothetical protein